MSKRKSAPPKRPSLTSRRSTERLGDIVHVGDDRLYPVPPSFDLCQEGGHFVSLWVKGGGAEEGKDGSEGRGEKSREQINDAHQSTETPSTLT